MEVVHGHASLPKPGDERVVLGSGPVGPHDVVEEQVVDVVRREPGQLQTGPVNDHLAELTNLRVNVEGHVVSLSGRVESDAWSQTRGVSGREVAGRVRSSG